MPQGEAEVPGSDGGDVTAAGTTSAKTNGKELSGTTAAGGCRRDTETGKHLSDTPERELRRYATESGEGCTPPASARRQDAATAAFCVEKRKG